MSLYCIDIKSTNQQSLNKFIDLFLKINQITKFGLVNKINSRKSQKKIVTVLKSPHVHKKAQEQFELGYFSYQFNVYSPQELKLILMFKKLKQKLFTDIKIKIRVISGKKALERKKREVVNPLNIKYKNPTYSNSGNNLIKKLHKSNDLIEKSIKSFDAFGETFLSLGSSVGRAKD